jgi:hypothetical protein
VGERRRKLWLSMVKLTVVEKVLAEEAWCLEHLQRVLTRE